MACIKPSLNITKLFIVLSLELVLITTFSTPVQSQVRSLSGWLKQSAQWVNRRLGMASKVRPVPVANRPTQQQARGGTRATYAQGKKPLTALIPVNEVGLTVAEYPTLLFYVPQTLTQAEFVLLEENDDIFYKRNFTVTGPPGIISLSLPTEESPLEVGKNYHWYFSIIQNPQDRSKDLVVEGWIKRVEPSPMLVSELEQAAPQTRPAIYAASGIWHETLTSLADLRRSRCKDLTLAADWTELLKSVELDEIAQEPLVQCCSNPNN